MIARHVLWPGGRCGMSRQSKTQDTHWKRLAGPDGWGRVTRPATRRRSSLPQRVQPPSSCRESSTTPPKNNDQLGRAVLTHSMSFDNPSSYTEAARSGAFSRVAPRVSESAAIRAIPVHKRDEKKKAAPRGKG